MKAELPPVDRERLIRRFTEMVSIDSETYHERAMADHVTAVLRSLGAEVYEDGAGALIGSDAGNLYAAFKGNAPGEPILLSGHLDTVRPGKGKRASIRPDGRIESDGTTVLGADDYAGLDEILEALTVMRERDLPHPDVEVLITVAEEAFNRGANVFDFGRVRARTAYVFDLSGEIGSAADAAPTILSFEADVTGRAAHAGFEPEKGRSAILAAAALMSSLPWGRLMDGASDGVGVTANVGLISGGSAVNAVPESCVLRGEFRSLDHAKAVAAYERLAAAASAASADGITVKTSFETPLRAYRTPRDSYASGHFAAAAKACSLTPSFGPTLGGSDNNVFCRKGISGLVVASGMNLSHTTREYTTADQLVSAARLALALIAAE